MNDDDVPDRSRSRFEYRKGTAAVFSLRLFRRAVPIPAFACVLIAFGSSPAVQAADFGANSAFPHLEPQHSAVDCDTCHKLKANETDLRTPPGHEACIACHNFAQDAVTRADLFCGACHNSISATAAHPDLYPFPRGRAGVAKNDPQNFGIKFSHVAHRTAGTAMHAVNPGKDKDSHCDDCHATLSPEDQAKEPDGFKFREKQSIANHAFCFTCHSDKPVNYTAAKKADFPSRNDCAVCHVGGEPPLVYLTEVPGFMHALHTTDPRLSPEAAAKAADNPDALCADCHKSAADAKQLSEIHPPSADTCKSCHNGKPNMPDVLPDEMLAPLAAKPAGAPK